MCISRLVPQRLVAVDVLRQSFIRGHCGVEQHTFAALALRHVAGVVPAQRRAHHRHAATGPIGHPGQHLRHGLRWRGGQLGAPPLHLRMALGDDVGQIAGFKRLGGGAKTVQVQQMGGGHTQ